MGASCQSVSGEEGGSDVGHVVCSASMGRISEGFPRSSTTESTPEIESSRRFRAGVYIPLLLLVGGGGISTKEKDILLLVTLPFGFFLTDFGLPRAWEGGGAILEGGLQ